ncbi:ABC transporter ATP-binding protein [Tepidimicrobium xylanilyticum]|uniref:ABC-2 type transport system ATP-binding protein n=1 Tax=Tepidimicrobium xylanilyticum TaxID=1123352 RepID=A0A1H2WIX7_9FIRM|nr:ATP-binding cassette domain-containing protein [Tepidimicrobium xylanilyticum]GMG95225.1 ABC transporter ATP-binding protein [Tepidimicrobium xylanilyticum]SDW80623.1 ABC-2 type transport system ATP-binding protein [Tepidimicrobium xylanilyticum]
MIHIKDLTKIYRVPKQNKKKSLRNFLFPVYEDKIAVDNISFDVEEAEIIGFVGTNGAGKTTTIKMLSGILTPTSGKIIVNGYIPYKNRNELSKNIAVIMGQKSVMFYDIPVIESFKFYKDVYSISINDYKKRMELFLDKLELSNILNIPVRKLSLGQKMRCEIAVSLLHNPKILFLDEPTIGLDIIAKHKILDFFTYLNKEFNTTIFLTTHDIADIDKICKRIIIIDKGIIRYDGAIKELKDRDQYKIIEIMHEKDYNLEKILDGFKKEILVSEEYKTTIKVVKQDVGNVVNNLINNPKIVDFNINALSLESVLQEIYLNDQGELL